MRKNKSSFPGLMCRTIGGCSFTVRFGSNFALTIVRLELISVRYSELRVERCPFPEVRNVLVGASVSEPYSSKLNGGIYICICKSIYMYTMFDDRSWTLHGSFGKFYYREVSKIYRRTSYTYYTVT